MNILLLADVSAALVIGGAERMLRQQALGLAERGHQIQLVTRAPEGDPRLFVQIGPVQEHRFVVSRSNELSFILSSMQRSVECFDRTVRLARPDLVIVYQSAAGIGPLLRRADVPQSWIYVCLSLAHEEYVSRAPQADGPAQQFRRTANTHARFLVEDYVMHRCRRVVVMSEFMKERVMHAHRISPDTISLIPGAADHEQFRPPEDRMQVRRSLGLPEDRTILFTLRNLVPRMGLEQLIDAMSLLGEEGRDLLLLIGGEGPLHQALYDRVLQRGLADHVRLLGFVPEDRLCRYYQCADLVVMPTLELEGFGLVTVEALAAGTPVLGTPVGALPEVLRRIDPYLITDGPAASDLADGLGRLLRRFRELPGEQERVARKGRCLIEQELNWPRQIDALASLLAEHGRGARATDRRAA
ncbi:MAG: glycosyltransferase family 4 protein [Nitrospiraceae bacterium]